jgi:uncharacterized DUF497 family protein
LKWDGHNREHIRRHAVSSWEVEDAIRDVRGTAFWKRDRFHGDRLVVFGRNRGGRKLILYLQPVNTDEGIWRCITAREANDFEKKRFFG